MPDPDSSPPGDVDRYPPGMAPEGAVRGVARSRWQATGQSGTQGAQSNVGGAAACSRAPQGEFRLQEGERLVRTEDGQAVRLRRRTPQERLAYRRRMHLIMAGSAAVVLGGALALLLWLRG